VIDDPLLEADDAATPLTADEKQGLIPSYITLRRELNEAEQIKYHAGRADRLRPQAGRPR
jgi:hypothetical protein